MQPMSQHVNTSLLPGYDFTVEPDPAVALVEGNGGHDELLSCGEGSASPFLSFWSGQGYRDGLNMSTWLT
jgi:hypothetical protein